MLYYDLILCMNLIILMFLFQNMLDFMSFNTSSKFNYLLLFFLLNCRSFSELVHYLVKHMICKLFYHFKTCFEIVFKKFCLRIGLRDSFSCKFGNLQLSRFRWVTVLKLALNFESSLQQLSFYFKQCIFLHNIRILRYHIDIARCTTLIFLSPLG